MLKKSNLLIIPLSLIFILSFAVTIINLGWKKSFIGDDQGVANYFPHRKIYLNYFTWDNLTAPGKTSVVYSLDLLFDGTVSLLYKLSKNYKLMDRFIYFAFFLISGLGLFLLLNILCKIHSLGSSRASIYFGAFTGSLLYMFNHFTMVILGFSITAYHLSYMLLPWALALFMYNLQIKTTLFSFALFVLFFWLLANGHPANTLSISFLLITYVVFFAKDLKKNNSRPLHFLYFSFIFLVALLSYVYLPVFNLGTNPYGARIGEVGARDSLAFNSASTSFLNLFRLTGLAFWSDFPSYNFYENNPAFFLLGYLMPILAIISILFYKGKKIKVFFGLTMLWALYFAKGAHPPIEKPFLFLYYSSPLGIMYRTVYYKFIFFVALVYSVLVGFFVLQTRDFLQRNFIKIKNIVILVPALICIYNFPFFTGNIVRKEFLTDIPKEYLQILSLIKEDKSDFKVILFPPAEMGAMLTWNDGNRYVGAQPDALFLDRPALDSQWLVANKFITQDPWDDIKFEEAMDLLINKAKFFNLKYVLMHRDYDFRYCNEFKRINGKIRTREIESFLKKYQGIELVKETPYYSFFKLSNKYFLPHIYSLSGLQFEEINNSLRYLESTPEIKFRRINPTKYVINIRNAKNPFWLIFSETFHKQWQLYELPQHLSTKELEDLVADYPQLKIKEAPHEYRLTFEDINFLFQKPLKAPHYSVNGYANGWYIDPDSLNLGRDFNLVLYFHPQSFFYLGMFLAGLATVILIGMIALRKNNEKK